MVCEPIGLPRFIEVKRMGEMERVAVNTSDIREVYRMPPSFGHGAHTVIAMRNGSSVKTYESYEHVLAKIRDVNECGPKH